MAKRPSNVQIHSFGFDGFFRVDIKGSTMNHCILTNSDISFS